MTDTEPRDPLTVPTPAQWVDEFLALDPLDRLTLAERILSNADVAHSCFIRNHQGTARMLRDILTAEHPVCRAGSCDCTACLKHREPCAEVAALRSRIETLADAAEGDPEGVAPEALRGLLAASVGSSGEAESGEAVDRVTGTPAEDVIEVRTDPDAFTYGPLTPAPVSSGGQADGETIERACEVMHDAYEAAAVGAGWETQAASRKPWTEVPDANKATMRAAVRALLDYLAARPVTPSPTGPTTSRPAARSVEQLHDLRPDLDRYQPGRHDRITRDDALPPSGPPPKGTLDEVVLSGVDVHLERMDDGWYWLGLTKGAGSRSLRVALGIGVRHGTRRRIVDAWVSDESGADLHLIPERTDEDPS